MLRDYEEAVKGGGEAVTRLAGAGARGGTSIISHILPPGDEEECDEEKGKPLLLGSQ